MSSGPQKDEIYPCEVTETVSYCCYDYDCSRIFKDSAKCRKEVDKYYGTNCTQAQVVACPC